jgi:hypothetical protein
MPEAALPNAVQYARKRTQTITWTDEDGIPVNLTGATLMGIIDRAGTESLITGTLTVTGATTGVFTWAYSAADVAEAGHYFVQFYARYSADSSLPEISYRHQWHVLPSFDFPFVSPSLSPSASVSPSASPSASS